MASGQALAYGLQAFMQGYDQQNRINEAEHLAEEARQDRKIKRERAATQWTQQQDDREHTLERRPVLEQRQDEQYGLQNLIDRNRLKSTEHELERQPVLDRQHDQAFASSQRARQHQIHMSRLREEAAQMGIDAKRLDLKRQQIGRAMGAGYSQFEMTGDTRPLVDAWNKHVSGTALEPIEQLTRNRDGSLTLKMRDAHAIKVQDDQHLMRTIATALDPDNFLKIYHQAVTNRAQAEAARAKNPKRFSELIRGKGGQLSRYDYQTGSTTPVTDEHGRPISGTLAGRSRGKSPEEIATQLYQGYVKSHLRPQQAEQQTAEYMRRAYPDAEGWWNQIEPPKRESQAGFFARLLGSGDDEGSDPSNSTPSARHREAGQAAGAATARPPSNARQAPDGRWYVPDPQRPGKYMLWHPGNGQ